MTYAVKIADIDAMPLVGFDWQLRTGLAAPIQGWAVPTHIAEQVVKQYLGKEIELKLHKVTVKRVIVLGTGPAGDPQLTMLFFTDVRWYWTRLWLVRDANVRRMSGTVQLVGEVPSAVQAPAPEVTYAPWSLAAKNTPFVWQPFVENLLSYAAKSVAAPGRPEITWTVDTTILNQNPNRNVEEVRIDDWLPTGLARAIAAMPGRTVYVDLDGVLHVSDGTLGAEIPTCQALKPDEALAAHGSLVLCNMAASRSKVYRVRFTPEYEVKCWFDNQGTRDANDPWFENVLRLPDKKLKVGIGAGARELGQGSLVLHDDAYKGWGKPTDPGADVPPLSEDIVRKHFCGPLLEVNYVLRAVPEPSALWAARIREVKGTFRTLLRLNPVFWSHVLSSKPERAAVIDVSNGQRAPSPVFSGFALKPRIRWLVANITKTAHTVPGYGTRTSTTDARDLKVSDQGNQPAPARLRLVDPQQGVFFVEWTLPPDGLYESIYPSEFEDVPDLDPKASAQASAYTIETRKLVKRFRLATIISCIPASPNSDKRLYEVQVTLADALQTLGVKGSPKLDALAPDKALRSFYATARFAWQDDQNTRDLILKVFTDDPGGSVDAGKPDLAPATLKPVNLDDELTPLAKALAAQEVAGQLDHYEGTMAVPQVPDLRPIGSIQVVTHRVTADQALTIVKAAGTPPPIDVLAMLPQSARRTILREIQS
jgi:hypothetical protein